jgi:hypothetical protein
MLILDPWILLSVLIVLGVPGLTFLALRDTVGWW